MNTIDYVKKNWLNLLALFFGIGGILTTLTVYQIQKKESDPIFAIAPSRKKVIDYDVFSDMNLIITLAGSIVTTDVSEAIFYFWNRGKKPIHKSDILEPIILSFDDKNVEIKGFKIKKVSRSVVKPKIKREKSSPSNKLNLSFDILEMDDGISGIIIYEGSPDVKLSIFGEIIEVRKIKSYQDIEKFQVKLRFYTRLPLILFTLIFLIVISKKIRSILNHYRNGNIKSSILGLVQIIFYFIVCYGLIRIFLASTYLDFYRFIPQSLIL